MEQTPPIEEDNIMLPVLRFNAQQPTTATTKINAVEIQCLKCDKRNQFPHEMDDYLAHLFLVHRLVIADVKDIALLETYLQIWQKQLQDHELEEYCTTMLLDQLPDGTPAKNEKYYLLSDVLPKDYELRKQLQQQRLEQALEQHQFERTDRTFYKECLYCRDVITGLRAQYLEHLFNKHFLQIGKPEKLVYIDELLAKVQHNLENLVCLYCEKIFKDRVTLKDHMRKKAHKRINPSNVEYDRFFLVNYEKVKTAPKTYTRNRQTHKPNNLRKHSDICDTLPQATEQTTTATTEITRSVENVAEVPRTTKASESSSVDFERHFGHNSDNDSDWSDWDDEQMPPLNCLFCAQQESTFAALKQHMLQEHNVDFQTSVNDLNFYQRIKVVNYVRRQVCLLRCVTCNTHNDSADLLLKHMSSEKHFGLGTQKQWDKPEYFFPTYEDDSLLCVLDDNPNDDMDETVVRIISEDTVAQINKDAERLSLENFTLL